MKTIDQDAFRRICEEVRQNQGAVIFRQVRESSERTKLLTHEAFKRVCDYLGLDFKRQEAELADSDGFALFQTLEEHMNPEFFYTGILDTVLLAGV